MSLAIRLGWPCVVIFTDSMVAWQLLRLRAGTLPGGCCVCSFGPPRGVWVGRACGACPQPEPSRYAMWKVSASRPSHSTFGVHKSDEFERRGCYLFELLGGPVLLLLRCCGVRCSDNPASSDPPRPQPYPTVSWHAPWAASLSGLPSALPCPCRYQHLSEAEYKDFDARLTAARCATEQRMDKVAAVQKSLEGSLELIGVTGVEDRLQVCPAPLTPDRFLSRRAEVEDWSATWKWTKSTAQTLEPAPPPPPRALWYNSHFGGGEPTSNGHGHWHGCEALEVDAT